MRILNFVLLILFIAVPLEAEIYKYVDNEGTWHFTNQLKGVPSKFRGQVERKVELLPEEEEGSLSNSGQAKKTTAVDLMRVAQKVSPQLQKPMLSQEFFDLMLVGEEVFIKKVGGALLLLKYQAPEAFENVKKHVKRIEQGKRTEMWAGLKKPTMFIHRDDVFHSTTFTAAIISHEACHAQLHFEKKSADPKDYEAIRQEEIKCIKYEINVMKEVGAPKKEVDMALDQDGTHFDLNFDGKFTLEDVLKRNR